VDDRIVDRSRWSTPSLSTDSAEAAERYREGIAALVSGAPHAGRVLDAAVIADDHFVLAHVARGVIDVMQGRPFPILPTGATTRGERQHTEVVRTMLAGDGHHGADLRREHLLEFPGDLLIVCLPMLVDRAPASHEPSR
jgi:hypothetical protein